MIPTKAASAASSWKLQIFLVTNYSPPRAPAQDVSTCGRRRTAKERGQQGDKALLRVTARGLPSDAPAVVCRAIRAEKLPLP